MKGNTDAKVAARKNVERAIQQADFMSVNAGVATVDVWDAEIEDTKEETHNGFHVSHDHNADPNTDESGTTEYFVSCEEVHGKVVPFRCSCPHHKYRNARCKHMKVVDMDVDANPFL